MQIFRYIVLLLSLVISYETISSECHIDTILKASKEKIVVSSGHRTVKHNKEVGGAINSNHLYACGARDVLIRPIENIKAFMAFLKSKGIRIIVYKDHLHLDWGI